MTKEMKFKLKKTMIKVAEMESTGPSLYVRVTDWGDITQLGLTQTEYLSLHTLKQCFEPADCDALNFIDPDRDKRILEKDDLQTYTERHES